MTISKPCFVSDLFSGHSPFKITPQRYLHYYYKDISIATLIKSADNLLPRFEHSHQHYEFCIPITPIPFLVEGGCPHFGEIGWVFPIPSNSLHGIKYDISDVSYDNIVIRKDFFDRLVSEKCHDVPDFRAPFKSTDELKMYINAFKKEFIKGKMQDEHKLYHLTALICDEIIDAGMQFQMLYEREKSGYQRGIHSAAEFLNDNYEKPIMLDEVAKMCGFSRNYFTTSFKSMFGDTPHVYLNKLRISKAKLLIKTTNITIAEIAQKCGFNKNNTFTQAFKATTGITPSKFKNACEQSANKLFC